MKPDFLPFQIDSQFEKFEFDVNFIDEIVGKDGLHYLLYFYNKIDKIKMYGFRVNYIALYFNCDLLAGVEIVFNNNVVLQYSHSRYKIF